MSLMANARSGWVVGWSQLLTHWLAGGWLVGWLCWLTGLPVGLLGYQSSTGFGGNRESSAKSSRSPAD